MLSKEEKINIGKRLIELREKNQLNSRQFAISVGVDPSQMAKMEKGTLGLSPYLANKIANKYHVNSNWIMFGTDQPVWNNIPNESDPEKELLRQRVADLEKIIALMEKQTAEKQSMPSEKPLKKAN